MKKLLYILVFGLFLVIVSCEEPLQTKEPYNESRELVPNPEGYKKDTCMVKPNDSALHKEKLKSDN